MNKFDETYYNMILEEAEIIKKSKIKSIIKSALENKVYRSIKSISNGFKFEILLVKPVIIKDDPQHTKKVDEFELTYNLENETTLKLSLTFKSNKGDKSAEKTIKLSTEDKLKADAEKFIDSKVSSLR